MLLSLVFRFVFRFVFILHSGDIFVVFLFKIWIISSLMTSVLCAGGTSSYVEGIVGEDVLLECPMNASNDDIIWWKGKERLVINGDVRNMYKDRISFNSSTGDLTIYSATQSDSREYICE